MHDRQLNHRGALRPILHGSLRRPCRFGCIIYDPHYGVLLFADVIAVG